MLVKFKVLFKGKDSRTSDEKKEREIDEGLKNM